MPKRRYATKPSEHHQTPYNSYVTKSEFEQLEALRKKIAQIKGIPEKSFSRGQFLMWMWRTSIKKVQGGVQLEDFCDGHVSELESMLKMMQKMIDNVNDFKDSALEDEKDGAESE